MSDNIRIIPKLEIKGPNLVKGVHLEGLRVLGKPEDFARYYYEDGADELIYMDVVASLYDRNSLYDMISRAAREIFIPLTVGGGLRTLEDMRRALCAGADKVSLNTAAVRNPELVRQAARKFGSSTIVVSIEAIKQPDGRYLAYTDNGREHTGKEVTSWAKQVEELGAGEILLTSVDNEGSGTGYDIAMTRAVASSVSIPVIACGGAGTVEDIKEVIVEGRADAVSLASMLHYHFIKTNLVRKDMFKDEGNIEYLKSSRGNPKVDAVSLRRIKAYLHSQRISCRHVDEAEAVNV